MVARNPAKFDVNVTQKSYNVRNCVHAAIGNAEKEVLPEIVCEWHFMRLSTNTCKLMILVNL